MEKINSFFNKEKQQFEVWKIDEENNIQALLLVQTIDEVTEHLKQHMIQTLLMMGGEKINI